jgi:hypothetical protein
MRTSVSTDVSQELVHYLLSGLLADDADRVGRAFAGTEPLQATRTRVKRRPVGHVGRGSKSNDRRVVRR